MLQWRRPLQPLSKHSFEPIRWPSPKLGMSMRRREFLGVLGGAAATWPLGARAQQPERVRRIGVLIGAADNPDTQANYEAFLQVLAQLGWTDGRNLRIDHRSGGGNADTIRKHAAELVALVPDVILTAGSSTMGPLLQATSI